MDIETNPINQLSSPNVQNNPAHMCNCQLPVLNSATTKYFTPAHGAQVECNLMQSKGLTRCYAAITRYSGMVWVTV